MTLFDLPDRAEAAERERERYRREWEAQQRTVEATHSPLARSTDPGTSHGAARRAQVNAGTNRARALLALDERELTDFELADTTGVAQTSIGVRRKELVEIGLVERSTATPRPSPSGTPAIVWRITDDGRTRARELRLTPSR